MKTLCTAFTAAISPLKGKSRPLLPMVCGIGKDVMEQNRIATNCFNITPAFSLLNLLPLMRTIRISNLVSSNLLLNLMTLSTRARLIKDNRHYLRTVAEVLLLTARQKLRVKNIMRQSLTFGQSCGKFLAILSVVARHDPVIAKRVQYGPSNAKYTHHTMQNALLDITKDMTLEQIREELSKAVYFTVLADESKDTSKKEQVVVAVQYFLNNGIQEEFVRIAETQSLDVDGLTDTIISQLGRIDVRMKNCVGQGYDGASVVAGRFNGVQKKLREKNWF